MLVNDETIGDKEELMTAIKQLIMEEKVTTRHQKMRGNKLKR